MIDIDSISLGERLVEAVTLKLPEEKRPSGDLRKRMIIRIGAALEANVLTLGDKVLLDLELRSLKSASEIVRRVFNEELGYRATEEILPEVFDLRSHLPELAAAWGKPIPHRQTPSKEALAIFDELIENPDVSRRHERDAILLPEYAFDESAPRHTVAVESGSDRDKFQKLDDALEHCRFFDHLELVRKGTHKSREEFRIIIKTHLIPMMTREEVGIYTDPTLTLHLVRRIMEAGYPRVAVAEGRNSFGNWFHHRGVCRVAARAGYIEEEDVRLEGPAPRKVTGYVLANVGAQHASPQPFDIIDLGLNTVDYDFKDETLGTHPVNREWMQADYRISFAKLKTHFAARYALHLINLSMALAMEDKIFNYPRQEDAARAVVTLVQAFPVHFSLIDGITGADRLLGYTHRPLPRSPGIIIAGQDMLATSSLGAQMMGIDPFESVYMREAARRMGGLTPYKVIGQAPLLKPWRNIRSMWVTIATRVTERFPAFSNFWVPLFIHRADGFFPPKGGTQVLRNREWLRWLTGVRFLLALLRLDTIPARMIRSLTDLRMRRMGERLKLSNSDPEFAEEIRHLRIDDLRRVRQILDTHGHNIEAKKEEVRRMGHIVRVGDKSYPFLGNDALGAICAGRLLKGVETGKWTIAATIPEIEGWMVIRGAVGSRL